MGNRELFPYKIEGLNRRKELEYVECRGAVVAHILSLGKLIDNEMKYPARINSFVAILCAKGSVTFSAHMTEYTLTENSLFIASSAMLQFKSCEDCELYIMGITQEFAGEMNLDMRVMMPVLSALQQNCVLIDMKRGEADRIMEHVGESFHALYNQYTEDVLPAVRTYRELALRHMIAGIIFRIGEVVVTRTPAQRPIALRNRSSDYFNRLVKLLGEHYRTERNVEFYAEKMNLTPKHLSRVVRNFSGKSVHQWIDEFVVLEIKNLLKYSDLSIQQISYDLNFANPSFMGQYFKRVTGKTPGQYRREI
ncbi:MAG: AraC family transcriptional regulator [Alistipes sp.]|nr:AraC family transcriptional regulator [Alistipes sp.]